jgi:hypothetical protein
MKYQINFKKSVKARKTLKWEIFSKTLNQAYEYAKRHLEDEYFGDAILLNVIEK